MTDPKLHIAFDRKDASKKIEIPLNTLKRHFAALGSSGSGKTVLVKCVMEECVRAGVPLLLVDLQGDLASLALMGDKKLMESKGVPGEYYDDFQNKRQVAIYTPASSKGIPISMNPLKAPPPNLDHEDFIQAVDTVADTVASILGFNTDKGKGSDVKSYLYLLLEAIWKRGDDVDSFGELANYITNDSEMLDASSIAMIDEKTKSQLAKKVKTMTIGADSLIFNLGIALDVERMMKWQDKGKVPINVLYLNTLRSAEDRVNFIADTASQVYNWMLRNPSEKIQLVFVLDELAGLVPPIRNPPTKKSIQLLLKQARKYGVSLLLATQNISDVDYKSLGQVGTWALGRLMAQQDIKKVEDIIQSISPNETQAIISELSAQTAGQFMLLAPDVYKSVQRIQARWLITNHTTLNDDKVRDIMDESGIREKFPEAMTMRSTKPVGKKSDETSESEEEEEEEDFDDADEAADAVFEQEVAIEANDTSGVSAILDTKPLAASAEEIATIIGGSSKKVGNELEKLVKSGKLESDDVNGITIYWSSKHKMDPKNNIIGPLFRMQLKYPQGPAKKLMEDKIPATLGIRKKAVVHKQDFAYIPMWRLNGLIREGEKRRFKKDVKAIKGFYYINALTGGILNTDKKTNIMTFPYIDIDPETILTLRGELEIKPLKVDEMGDEYHKPILNRQDAIGVAEQKLGILLNKKIVPSLVWMPVWEFMLRDKDTKGKSKAWVDGYSGFVIMNSNPIDDEDTSDQFFNI